MENRQERDLKQTKNKNNNNIENDEDFRRKDQIRMEESVWLLFKEQEATRLEKQNDNYKSNWRQCFRETIKNMTRRCDRERERERGISIDGPRSCETLFFDSGINCDEGQQQRQRQQ